MSTEQSISLDLYSARLQETNASGRNAIYSEFLSSATQNPATLGEVYDSLIPPDNGKLTYWETQLSEKLKPETVYTRFKKGARPTTEDMFNVLSQFEGDDRKKDLIAIALRGYFDQPFEQMKKAKGNPVEFWKAADYAIELAATYAQTLLAYPDKQRVVEMVKYQNRHMIDPPPNNDNSLPLFTLLHFIDENSPDEEQAAMAGLTEMLIDAMDYQVCGHTDIKSPIIQQNEQLIEKNYEGLLNTANVPLARRIETHSQKQGKMYEEKVNELMRLTDPINVAIFPAQPTLLGNFSEVMQIKNFITEFNHYFRKNNEQQRQLQDGRVLPPPVYRYNVFRPEEVSYAIPFSFDLPLPGHQTAILYIRPTVDNAVTERDIREAAKELILARLHALQRAPIDYPITLSEIGTLFNYVAPDFDPEKMLMYSASTRELGRFNHGIKAATEYTKEINDDVANAVGLSSITYKKVPEGTEIEIDILGTIVRGFMDRDYMIDFLEFNTITEPKMRAWLEAEIYTHMMDSEQLNPDHIINGMTEDERQERATQDTRALLEKIKQHPEEYTIDDEQFIGLSIEFSLPPLDTDSVTQHINTMREQSISGLYTVSRRGYKVIVDDPIAQTIGLSSIEFKKTRGGTRVHLDFDGRIIERVIDTHMNVPDSKYQKMNVWLQSQIFTYLARIRQGEVQEDDVTTTRTRDTQSTGNDDSIIQGRSNEGQHRAAHLRVLPIRHKYHLAERSETPVTKLTEEDFGVPLGILNHYFGLAQTNIDLIQELPIAQQGIIRNLIQRIQERGVEPTWVSQYQGRATPLMILNNPPNPPNYDPLIDIYTVTYVVDTTVENDDPQEVRFDDVSFEHLYAVTR